MPPDGQDEAIEYATLPVAEGREVDALFWWRCVEVGLDPNDAMAMGPLAALGLFWHDGGRLMANGKAKVGKVMDEFKAGELRSGSDTGPKVTNPKQALAIGLSEARKAGAKVKSPKVSAAQRGAARAGRGAAGERAARMKRLAKAVL